MPELSTIDERLARTAHTVSTPFSERYLRSGAPLDDAMYGMTARNVGEYAAAGVLCRSEALPSSNDELLIRLYESAEQCAGSYTQRFTGDEYAVAHAAQVFIRCTTELAV
jgi:hypothetical protein